MFKEVDGRLVLVPDSAAITPELREIRTTMNAFLNDVHVFMQSPEGKELQRRYYEVRMADLKGFEWFAEPAKEQP